MTDTVGRGIPGAQVYIRELQRMAEGDTNGAFRFGDVPLGTYDLAARRLGFYPQVRTVVLATSNVPVTFALVPYVRLEPIIVSAETGGIHGVVTDANADGLEGAMVYAVATGQRAKTDSAGRFHLDVKPGKHVVRIERDAFAPVLVSITLPRDSGRRLVVALRSRHRISNAQEKRAFAELRERMLRRSPIRSAIFTREDILGFGYAELSDIVNAGAGRPVNPGCEAIVDGGPRRELIWALRAGEIEMVEVYESSIEISRVGSREARIRSESSRLRSMPGCRERVYVWTRK